MVTNFKLSLSLRGFEQSSHFINICSEIQTPIPLFTNMLKRHMSLIYILYVIYESLKQKSPSTVVLLLVIIGLGTKSASTMYIALSLTSENDVILYKQQTEFTITMELINNGIPPFCRVIHETGLAHGDNCNRKFRLLLSTT